VLVPNVTGEMNEALPPSNVPVAPVSEKRPLMSVAPVESVRLKPLPESTVIP